MNTHHLTTARRRARGRFGKTALVSLLAATALAATTACSVIDDLTGSGQDSTSTQQSSESGGDNSTDSAQDGAADKGSANGEMSSAVAALSDDAVRAAFKDGTFHDCALVEEFFTQSFMDAENFVNEGTEPGVFFNDQSCIGYVGGSSEDVSGVYLAVQASADAQGADDTSMGDKVTLEDAALGDWLAMNVELPGGFSACLFEGPENTPLDSAVVAGTVRCDYAYPLLRNLQDLAVRYQELEGETPSFDYAGDTERPRDFELDSTYKDKLDAAEGIGEPLDFEHPVLGDLELQVSNFRPKGDEAMDMGIVCFAAEYSSNMRMTRAPSLVLQQPDGSHILLCPVSERDSMPLEKAMYCTEQAILFTNADLVIGAVEDSMSPSSSEAHRYTPLWKIHAEIRDGKLEVTDVA